MNSFELYTFRHKFITIIYNFTSSYVHYIHLYINLYQLLNTYIYYICFYIYVHVSVIFIYVILYLILRGFKDNDFEVREERIAISNSQK